MNEIDYIQMRLKSFSNDDLKLMAIKSFDQFEIGDHLLFNAVINELQERLNEEEFKNFCETL